MNEYDKEYKFRSSFKYIKIIKKLQEEFSLGLVFLSLTILLQDDCRTLTPICSVLFFPVVIISLRKLAGQLLQRLFALPLH